MITAQQINELRQKTKISMMLCKKALEATDGDQDLAVEWLRKNGNSVTDNTSNESAEEYEVITYQGGNKIEFDEPIIIKSGEHFKYENLTSKSYIDITIDENTKQFYSFGNYVFKIVKH